MLELAGRVGLGVDVADLLELQRAFERDRVVQAAAEEQRVLLAGEAGEFFDTQRALSDIAYDVLLDTDIRIQALPIWQEEWDHPDRYSNPYLLRNIRREGIAL